MFNIVASVFHNLLEPLTLVGHFNDFPPQDFSILKQLIDLPAFSGRFDLLTTMESDTRRTLEALPLSKLWRRFLYTETCFIGTTVTEYVLLPKETTPELLLHNIQANLIHRFPFLIIKDIPTESSLVGIPAYEYAKNLMHVCQDSGYVLIEGQALAYVRIDFPTIDAYLSRLSRTRRKDLKRKLKSMMKLDIEIIHAGDAYFQDENVIAKFYELYLNVYQQSNIHFDLLTEPFFRAILQDSCSRCIIFVYRADNNIIGYNICFVEGNMLMDKYVGFSYPKTREYNLYTVSWFCNLKYALDNGLQYYVAGWTDPEIKRNLGAKFTMTRHAVYVRNPILRILFRSLKRFFEADHQWRSRNDPSNHS